MPYDHRAIEAKWQARYEAEQPFKAETGSSKPKFYPLVEFPFPSGAGLHVGHPRSYTALDVVARVRRMQGFNVLYPMGWDAFGLPTENYALKTGIPPAEVTLQNTDIFRRQLKAIGFSFDWSREVNTTDPAYFKWTQWMFLEFFKAGLAYKAKAEINWCPKDKIGLANEEVIGGACERCGTTVEKREKEQWMIAITKYADRLIEDLAHVNYLPKIKKQQEDWIGRSEGAEIDFAVEGREEKITVFTTRPDTIFGVTALVLAPEHPWVAVVSDELSNKKEVLEYVESVKGRDEAERTADGREKTGVELKGVMAVHPLSGEMIRLFIADYVLPQYGTGAIMAVPAHDERDYAFAVKFKLPILQVIKPLVVDHNNPPRDGKKSVTRKTVQVIVRNPVTGKFLVLRWKNHDWTTFVVGGVEEGEALEVAALREVREETGYTDLKFTGVQSLEVQSQYYAAHKDENRVANVTALFFDLQSEMREEISAEEVDRHEVLWLDRSELTSSRMTCSELSYWLTTLDLVWGQGTQVKVAAGIAKDWLFTDEGILRESRSFDDLSSADAREKIISHLVAEGRGQKKVTYRLRDWVFSRQRYWGEPIPLVKCQAGCGAEHGGWVPLPVEQLPLTLPAVGKYEPTDTGESPLAAIADWVNTTCPECGGAATRETDTMPNWAGSSWYFLRYVDPHNDQQFASPEALVYWLPVDLYNGGMEHTTLHLLYSRFWYKFLFDQGHIPKSCGNEPYARRHSHGLIMAEDGAKMSKSKGNVVNPDEVVAEYGADVLRTYMLFIGPFEEPAPWQKNGLIGVRRFLEKVERLAERVGAEEPLDVTKAVHRAIAKVTADIDGFRFNTGVAALMTALNDIGTQSIARETYLDLLTILSPFAPHVANELAERVGYDELLDRRAWPTANGDYLVDDTVTIAVQFAGKTRGAVTVSTGATQEVVLAAAQADSVIAKYFVGEPKKIIFVPGRILNIIL